MTICRPAAIAARAWAIPAAGDPVASTTTSTSGSVHNSLPEASNRVRSMQRVSQPTLRQASRARSVSRSAIVDTSSPGIVGTWFRNIEPNLPAPISPTRTGLLVAARCCSRRWRFIALFRRYPNPALPGKRGRVREGAVGAGVLQQRVVGHRLDRREVTVRDPFGPGRLADVIRDSAQRQVDDAARVRRDVRCRAVHEVPMEHQYRAGLAGRRDDTALVDEPSDGLLVERPQRVGGCLLLVARPQHPL